MSSRLLDSVFSTENADTEDFAMDTTLSVEEAEAALSVEEAAHDVEINDLTVEELNHAAESLESIQASMEAALENEERGLSVESAQAYQLAIHGVVGDAISNPVGSLESFGADSTRKEATEASLEGVAETIKNLWESIKKQFSKAMDALKSFFKKLFDGVTKSKKKVGEIVKSLEEKKSSGATTETKEIDIVSAKAMADVEGNVSLGEGCKTFNELYETHVSTLVEHADDFYAAVNDAANNVDVEKAVKDDDAKSVKKADWAKPLQDLKKAYSSKSDLPNAKYPGQVEISEILMEDDEGEGADTSIVGFRFHDAKNAKKPGDKMEMLSLDDAIEAAKCIESLLEQIEKGKERRDSIVKTRSDVMETVEKVSKEVQKDAKDAEKEQSKRAVAVFKKLSKLASKNLTGAIQKIDNTAYKFARAAMKNLEKIDGEYKKGSE